MLWLTPEANQGCSRSSSPLEASTDSRPPAFRFASDLQQLNSPTEPCGSSTRAHPSFSDFWKERAPIQLCCSPLDTGLRITGSGASPDRTVRTATETQEMAEEVNEPLPSPGREEVRDDRRLAAGVFSLQDRSSFSGAAPQRQERRIGLHPEVL
jgi:hypothetical protein